MVGKSFEEKLKMGKAGAKCIADWFCRNGYSILPVEKDPDIEGGPVIYQVESNITAPDMIAFKGYKQFGWIEAKTKSAFTWHRISQKWTTGIDIYLYNQYIETALLSSLLVYLLFLQLPGQAKNSPPGCPTGLFGGELEYLLNNENHRHANWGISGMVYWSVDILEKFAELNELDLTFLKGESYACQGQTPERHRSRSGPTQLHLAL